MHALGVKVLAKTCDVASKDALEAVVRDLQVVDRVGPVRGVINAAMALEVSATNYTKIRRERFSAD
jgi:hypothetical protein